MEGFVETEVAPKIISSDHLVVEALACENADQVKLVGLGLIRSKELILTFLSISCFRYCILFLWTPHFSSEYSVLSIMAGSAYRTRKYMWSRSSLNWATDR